MVSDVSVDYEEMASVAQLLTSSHEEISSTLGQLKARIDQLVTSGFRTDVSSKKFEEGYTEFNTGVTQTIEGLLEMSKFLNDYVNSIREIDQT